MVVSAGVRDSYTAGRVVILGGTGWLGSHVADVLAARGVPTAVVSRSAEHPHGRVDLRTYGVDDLAHLLRGARAVVNCTDAVNATDGGVDSASGLQPLNVALVERLAQAVGRASGQSLVHIGTILEYGAPLSRAWRETDDCTPTGAYARSKLAGSDAVRAAARNRTCDAVVLRVGNLVGPRPTTTTFPGHLTRLLATAERDGGDAVVVTNQDVRDFVDVRDVAQAVVRLLELDPGTWPEVVNLSTGTTTRVEDLVRRLVRVSRLPDDRVHVSVRDLESTGGPVTWASPELARTALGWEATRSLDDSLLDMWAGRATVLS